MESITDLAPEIQKRIRDFEQFLARKGMKRPEVKFTGAIVTAMLKKPHVHLTVLARNLEEKISRKKTWERLNRNLSKEDLGKELIEANIQRNAHKIREFKYCAIDGSDIQKPEAKQMKGLGRVRDGSKKRKDKKAVIGNGYYWLNAVMANKEDILPVHSDIYSLNQEAHNHVSEHTKIHEIIDMIHDIHPDAIYTIDRAGDGGAIITPLIDKNIKFVLRGQSKRSLRLHVNSAKTTNIKEIAKRTKTSLSFKSPRNGEMFSVGIRKVYLDDTPLWLVVSRRQSSADALSWYLTNVQGSRQMVMMTTLEAYGLRWRIEEYHRQIKQDYHLEEICLRKYNAIKNMGVIVMLAASFIARLPENLAIKLIALSNLLPRKRLSDMPSYQYYMITAAVSRAMQFAHKRRWKPLRMRKRDYFQLNLDLTGF